MPYGTNGCFEGMCLHLDLWRKTHCFNEIAEVYSFTNLHIRKDRLPIRVIQISLRSFFTVEN